MTKDLTEAWKNGELPEGNYYIKDKYGNFIIAQYLPDYDYDHQDGYCFEGYRWCALGFDYDDLEQDSVVEVLAPVPSYDHFVELTEKDKENAKLRELLKEWVKFYPIVLYEYEDILKTKDIIELREKTVEVLK